MVFSEAHQAFRESVAGLVQRQITPFVDEWEAQHDFPDSVFTTLGDAGFLGTRFPETYGGQGGDYLSSIVLAEEMASCGSAAVAMAVSVHTDMATPPILQFGTSAQKEKYLPACIAGRIVAAIAMTEANAGSDLAAMETRATRTAHGWLLEGSKLYITNGMRAGLFLLAARTGRPEDGAHGLSLFLVEGAAPGLSRRRLEKLGMNASDTAELSLVHVELPQDSILGEPGAGFSQLMWELRGERLIAAASALAGARAALGYTLEWCRERRLFGTSLASFQVTRHTLAELQTDVTVATSFVHSLAAQWDQGVPPPDGEIAMAKLVAGRVASRVADTCLQLFGGAGYMAEMPISRYFRDSRLMRIGGGTDEVMKEIIARAALKL